MDVTLRALVFYRDCLIKEQSRWLECSQTWSILAFEIANVVAEIEKPIILRIAA